MLKSTVLFFFFLASAFAQDCFRAPVTTGTLTVSCSAIDNTSPTPSLMDGEPGLFAGVPPISYLLAVRVVSTDSSTVAFRITAKYPEQLADGTVSGRSAQSVALITKKPTSLPDPVPLTYIFSIQSTPWPVKITSINVEELKAVSSQTAFTAPPASPPATNPEAASAKTKNQ
jgi:hypothetical protein